MGLFMYVDEGKKDLPYLYAFRRVSIAQGADGWT